MRASSVMPHILARVRAVLAVVVLFLASAGFCIDSAMAQDKTASTRPKVGLVLGGGGARGAAHVGVLKTLEKMNVPVDYIAGTSMGAIIGGLYASGRSPEEIEELLATTDWDRIISDDVPRQKKSIRRKEEDLLFLVKFEMGFRDGKFRTPEAIIPGALFDSLLRWYGLRVRDITDFDKLPVPYRAVAADIETGEEIVLDRGDLGVAMRASSSIPGVFAPVHFEGRLLVDGGIVNNLPVDIVKRMGADILIVVDVGTPLREELEDKGFLGVTGQVMRMMTRKNADEQIAQLRDRDVLIRPRLEGVATMDFKQSIHAIEAGEAAADRVGGKLERLSVSKKQYEQFLKQQRVSATLLPRIDYIQIENDSNISSIAIKARMKIKPGDILSQSALQDDIERIYGMGDFEYVSFLLVQDQDLNGLIIETRAKSYGPNYFRFGFTLETDFEGTTNFDLGVDFTRRPMNRLGGEWKNLFAIGNIRGISSEFYQPLVYSGRFFVAPQISWFRELEDVFAAGGDKLAEIDTRHRIASIDFGVNFGKTCCELRLGIAAGDIKSDTEIGPLTLPRVEGDVGAYQARFIYDMLDSASFPRHGQFAALFGFYPRKDINSSDFEYDKTAAAFLISRSIERHTLGGSLNYGSSGSSTLPFFAEFSLGGFLNLSGLKPNELRGQYSGLTRLFYYYQLKKLALGNAFYLGGSLEAGNVWDERDQIFDDNITAGSLFFGAETVIGPVFLAYGAAEGGRDAAYLFVGQRFSGLKPGGMP
ncbi:MAG: patatin-like phospholipase family protein [Acidiferrobacterales bacterium]